jgi:hypothetical protein
LASTEVGFDPELALKKIITRVSQLPTRMSTKIEDSIYILLSYQEFQTHLALLNVKQELYQLLLRHWQLS